VGAVTDDDHALHAGGGEQLRRLVRCHRDAVLVSASALVASSMAVLSRAARAMGAALAAKVLVMMFSGSLALRDAMVGL